MFYRIYYNLSISVVLYVCSSFVVAAEPTLMKKGKNVSLREKTLTQAISLLVLCLVCTRGGYTCP